MRLGHLRRYGGARWALKSIAALADAIWPPRSLVGGAPVSAAGVVEAEIWSRLKFLGAPLCARCGFPFESEVDALTLCAACLTKPPAFDCARAALAYGDDAKAMVLGMKRSGRRDGLATYARWMTTAGGEMLSGAPTIAPVPLHWTRLAERTFNQAAWLAQAVAEETGHDLDVDLLRRVKRRRSQAGLNVRQRRLNVRGAFAVRADAKLAGARIVLIDDVYTTGATASACAKALRRAGAGYVGVLTLARVVRPTEALI